MSESSPALRRPSTNGWQHVTYSECSQLTKTSTTTIPRCTTSEPHGANGTPMTPTRRGRLSGTGAASLPPMKSGLLFSKKCSMTAFRSKPPRLRSSGFPPKTRLPLPPMASVFSNCLQADSCHDHLGRERRESRGRQGFSRREGACGELRPASHSGQC